jgi:hypothetical protein
MHACPRLGYLLLNFCQQAQQQLRVVFIWQYLRTSTEGLSDKATVLVRELICLGMHGEIPDLTYHSFSF